MILIRSIHGPVRKELQRSWFRFYTKGKDELSMLSEKLRQIESVFEIERTTG